MKYPKICYGKQGIKHPAINYDVDDCPLCAALEKVEVLKGEIEELTTEVEDLRNYKHIL